MHLQNRLSEQRDAAEAVDSRDRRHSLSSDQFDKLRTVLLNDSYLFTIAICKHKELVPELHMPMSYAACGLTDRLIEVLDAKGFDSFVTKKFREELWKRGIDWKTAAGREALDVQLDFLNFRWFRGSFKSSVITHASPTFLATRDPNSTIKITHAVDDKAWAFCEQIGKTIQSGIYRDLFPDRVPLDENREITMKAINLAGRTISHPQKTINASGYKTKEEAAHYDTFFTDDLVNEGNSSPIELKGVRRWQTGMPGMYMTTRRIRRREIGTKHDEDDDDTFLCRKELARECLTIRVPIEEHDTDARNILQRGKPTIPQMFTPEKITKLQRHVLSDESEPDGVRSWRCNFLLDPAAGGARLFPPSLVDDPDNWWLGPFDHPKKAFARLDRFIVARFDRDGSGLPIPKPGMEIVTDAGLIPDWREKCRVLSFCPWTEMDRVALVDPAWAKYDAKAAGERRNYSEPDNWAVSAIATDPYAVAFQLQTLSERSGTEGWIEALAELDEFFHFRVIGFDGAAMQDAMIQNLMKTDARLRKMRGRMVKVPHNGVSKRARMRAGLAEPLNMHAFLLDPTEEGNATREELKGIKGVMSDTDGIADSLAMHRAVNRRTRTTEEKEKVTAEAILREVAKRRTINPILGVPIAA